MLAVHLREERQHPSILHFIPSHLSNQTADSLSSHGAIIHFTCLSPLLSLYHSHIHFLRVEAPF